LRARPAARGGVSGKQRAIIMVSVFRRSFELPLYEYRCRRNGHRFEKIERHTASRKKKCPECGGTAERLVSSPAIQFKGSGWYVTDYAGKGAARTESADAGDSAKPAAESAAPKSGKDSREKKSSGKETGKGK
jgi:putative FmdB family regulatory protein